MKLSRSAKRYDDSVLPGDFSGFEAFHYEDVEQTEVVEGSLKPAGGGMEFSQIIMERTNPKRQSFAKMRSKAEALAEQINYLKERLEVVDHDRRGMYIQLRSLPPYKDDHQIQFNEICIGRNKVVVKRIAFYRREEVKQQVPLQLSDEQVRRLLADIHKFI